METPSPRPYSIGEVVSQLRPEYEISESNLRFWEKQGLLLPQRSPGGHRLYTAADVARIRLIKRMQANRYMPLAAIRHLCEAHGEALDDDATAFFETFYRPRFFESGFTPLPAAALAAETGLETETVRALSEAGILSPVREAEDGPLPEPLYDEDDRQLCRMLGEILALGIPMTALARKSDLIRAHVQAEWDEVIQPMLPQMMAVPPQAKLRLKALSEELETILFDKARRLLKAQHLKSGASNPHPCPKQEER